MSGINMINKIAERWMERLGDDERLRLQRAVEGLRTGKIRVISIAPEEYEVRNGTSLYRVRNHVQVGRWVCECPDFANRGIRCKHLFAVFLAERGGLVEAQQPAPEPAPEAVPAAPAPEAPQGAVVPFGRHKGKPLADAAREDPDLLFWIIRKMEVRSDRDRLLKEEARALAERMAQEKASQVSPDEILVPFGDEKGKPLSRCHPKWVAVLARKGIEDAFNLQDAVTYEVARRLQEQRRQKKSGARSGLDAETLKEAIREAVLAALQEAQRSVWDREAILAELAQIRSRLDRLEKKAHCGADALIALKEAR